MTIRLSNHTENSHKNSPMKCSSYCIIHLPVLLWPEKRGLHLFQTAQNGFGASVEFLFNDSSLIFAGSSSSSSSPYSINLTNVSEIQNVATKASLSNQIKTGGKISQKIAHCKLKFGSCRCAQIQEKTTLYMFLDILPEENLITDGDKNLGPRRQEPTRNTFSS